MIAIDVDLVASPRILGPGASISETIDLAGGLGTDILNAPGLVDPVSTVVDLSGTLTGGRDVMYGSVSVVVDPVATRRRLFIQSAPTNYYWYYDGGDEYPWAWVYKPRTLLDASDPDIDPKIGIQIVAASTLSAAVTPVLSLPSPPAPAPPEDPEVPGSFPMPAYGGISIRALHGVVVDMDPPVIDDGIPT